MVNLHLLYFNWSYSEYSLTVVPGQNRTETQKQEIEQILLMFIKKVKTE